MFRTPLPRSSFLDSSLRACGRENRRLAHGLALGTGHLGRGHRSAPTKPGGPTRLRERARHAASAAA